MWEVSIYLYDSASTWRRSEGLAGTQETVVEVAKFWEMPEGSGELGSKEKELGKGDVAKENIKKSP